ncbi:ATP-dependent DNA helicase RecG [Clostridium swellfunianum]|uniref:ATP-dependent DNA helicase RecG n=1 Tax=Clostridium swellfunianum TaxID=1367462 RepID=UPI00202E245A|nr:ATP-dependent DNA helicase RecG [Clostridium swellfunianum]MCM0648716.1 ATP-dependent DNA helicase RecG [Clostridium swellfunianum]
MDLYDDISCVKGVGPKMKKLFNECGVFTVMDILLYLPRDYEKVYVNGNASQSVNSKIIINCTVSGIERDIRTKSRKIISTVIFKCNGNTIKGKWFNQPYMKDKFIINKDYLISGKLQEFRGEKIIVNPTIATNSNFNNEESTICDSISESNINIMPKYSLKEGLSNNTVIKIISYVLSTIEITEILPDKLIDKYRLCSLDKAINNIHFPQKLNDLLEAQRRIKFQELFTYSLKILMLKDFVNNSKAGIEFKAVPELKLLKENLPFSLTNAQSRVIREILLDQKSSKQMNRLVQGDVGSGKTIVAIIAMFNIVKNGYQAAMMAPTEILANQHFAEIKNILQNFNINICLLSGSTTPKQKAIIKKKLIDGTINIIVGTHALLEDDVQFKNLALVVTDEQHRFGVMQRSKLYNKGNKVDVLVMTATPIPRTLALYLYGDLDVSVIDELPPGRQKIETSYVEEKKAEKVYRFALKEIHNGRQVYLVCPLVEDNEELSVISVEKLYLELKEGYFKDVETSILHGKMTNKEKDEIMSKFKNGDVKVLISTTVIEVGINVPNASVMIIQNAERFGLAQLHQLRGRVGRGEYKSYCVLIANIKNEIIKKRLEIITESNDGFKIAEEDLKIRGSGELFGVRQHGEDSLLLADVFEDLDILKVANFEAKKLIKSNDDKDIMIKNEIIRKLNQTSKFICFN